MYISYSFAKEFRENKENLAKTATLEMGKAIRVEVRGRKRCLGDRIFCR